MKLQVFILIASAAWNVFGASGTNLFQVADATRSVGDNSTNVFYITDRGSTYIGASGRIETNPQDIAEARTNRESWPAKDFPEGNWGQTVDGIQISLRFDKPVYTNHEPLNVVVLVRNTTNHFLIFLNANDVAPGEINFLAYHQSGQFVSPRPRYAGLRQYSAGGVNVIRPGLQRKYGDTLNRTYDLTNGNYLVEASIMAYRMTGSNIPSPNGIEYEITSAKVPIVITNSP